MNKNRLKLLVLTLVNLGTVLYQNLRITVLADLTYIIDHAYRISRGQILYKDFGVPVSPGTFLIQAAVIKIFGLTFIPQIIYCCCLSALTIFIVYKILFILNPGDNLNFFILLPAVIAGGYTIFPHPFYDIDCIFFILLAILIMLYSCNKKFSNLSSLISGFVAAIPLFFKQNLGSAFIISLHFTILIVSIFKKNGLNLKKYVIFLSGSALTIVLCLLVINVTCGLENYFFWTYHLAQTGKGLEDITIFRLVWGILRTNYLNLPVIITAVLCFTIYLLHLKKQSTTRHNLFMITIVTYTSVLLTPMYYILIKKDNFFDGYSYIWISFIVINLIIILIILYKGTENWFLTLLPMIPASIISGALLGGDIQYSTYAFWPIFSILLGMTIVNLRKVYFLENIKINVVLASIAVLTTLILIFYIGSEYRLRYIDLNGKITSADYPALKGLSTPGNYLLELQNLIEFTNKEIPRNDGVLVIPAEDPFYFAANRLPVFSINFFQRLNIPYSDDLLLNKINQSPVRWLIIKTKLQFNFSFINKKDIDFDTLISKLKNNFKLYKELNSYQIYIRREVAD